MKRHLKWIIPILAGIVIAVVAYNIKQKEGKTITTSTVSTETIKLTALESQVTATGTIEPIKQIEVGTQVSGKIEQIYVDYNSIVKKGDILAELDKTVLQSQLTSQKTLVKSAKTEYDYQQKNYNRIQILHKKELISEQAYETAFYQYDRAKNDLDKAKSDLIKANQNLYYATIYSPIDGIVLSRSVDEGQTVAASFNTPTLFTIANDLTKMQVVANVDEADIGQVQKQQNVTFTVDAYPNDEFKGQIIQVRQEAKTTSNVVTYEVIINAPNPDLKLKPGLTANVIIKTIEKKEVLTIPNQALIFTPKLELPTIEKQALKKSSPHTIWILKEGVITETAVEIGVTNGFKTEVLSNLAIGSQVATGYTTIQKKGIQKKESNKSPFMPTHKERR